MSQFVNSLIPSIESILRSADLDKVSAKSVRKTLIAQGVDEASIKQHKEELDKRIEKIYLALPTPGEDIKPKSEPKPSSQISNGFNPTTSPQVPLTSTSKRSASPTKKPKDVKPPAPIDEDADAAFARKLQAELDATSSTGRSSRAAANGKPKKKAVVKSVAKRKSAATVGNADDSELDSEEGGKKKKRKSGGGGGAFNALMLLSEPLADLTGQTHLSRPGTVKAIWDHVKANNLQDASDKRFLICDEKMKKVFGSDRIHMFTMNKVLGKHLFKPEDIVQ